MDISSYLLGKKAGGGSGTSDYSALTNKPSINGVTLSGNKTSEDLGIEVPTIPEDLLHYKGHVNTENDLPSLGQPSGITENPMLNLNKQQTNNLLNANSQYQIAPVWEDVIRSKKYFILFGDTQHTNSFVIATDYPEQVKFGIIGTPYTTPLFHIDYDANKPVYYANTRVNSFSTGEVRYVIDGTTSSIATPNDTTLHLIEQSCYFFQYNVNKDGLYLFGEIFCLLSNFPKINFNSATSLGITYPVDRTTLYNSIKIIQDDDTPYIYNDGMVLFTNIGSDYITYQLSETTVKENDTYTVGNTNEIYRANAVPQWEHWSNLKNMTGYDATKTQTLKNVNGTIEWVDE